jgi:sortase A
MRNKLFLKLIGAISGLTGFMILFYVFYPIVAYELAAQIKFKNYLLPVPASEKYVYAGDEAPDYTKAENWFPASLDKYRSTLGASSTSVKYYTITINSLGIKNATVSVGGEDLNDSLIQYPGTALPGKVGNTVIFGHSVLPQFFNPKDYLTIFSTLPKISKGDAIQIDYDGISYDYEVGDIFEVSPDDIEVLSQDGRDPYVTLVTCVPPGHPLRPKRLIVRAKLVPTNERKVYDLSGN